MTSPSERPSRRLGYPGAAGFTIALVVGLVFVVSLTASLREGAETDVVNLTGCYALVHLALVFVLVRLYRPEDRLRDALGLRLMNPLHVLLAAAVGAGVYPALARINDRFSTAFPIDHDDQEKLEALYSTPTLRAKIALFVGLVFVIPACEELLFRGVLFGALQRGRSGSANLLRVVVACAGYFALAQANVRVIATAFLLGLVLGWLRARGGSTFLSFVAQVAHLAVPLGPLLHGGAIREDASFDLRWVGGGLAMATLAAGGLALSFRSSKVVAAARDADARDAAVVPKDEPVDDDA